MINIAGTYKVVEYGYSYKNGKAFEPISEWFSGTIHYSETGYMSVIMRFKEKPEVFTDIVAYSGTYVVTNDEIIHQVNMSVRPDYEGQTLVRKFKIENGNLELEFENTDEFRKYAIWKRV
ncbi:MAG: lipocalin-like domain-containing protein [Pseudobdellovibrio sp.]